MSQVSGGLNFLGSIDLRAQTYSDFGSCSFPIPPEAHWDIYTWGTDSHGVTAGDQLKSFVINWDMNTPSGSLTIAVSVCMDTLIGADY